MYIYALLGKNESDSFELLLMEEFFAKHCGLPIQNPCGLLELLFSGGENKNQQFPERQLRRLR